MSTRSQNKPPRSPSSKNSRIGDLHLEKRRKVGTGRMVGVANNTGRGRQPFSSVNNRQDAAANAGDLAGTEGSECGTVEFTKEEVEALLNEKFKGKKFDLKGKMEQMNDHIRKLKLCLKWFQEVEEGHIKEKEKLCNTLESAERKCTETEVAMKKMEVELNLLITELTAKTTLLQENLAKEESEKLDAIECQRREKEAKVVAEKLQASLKEELEKAEQRKSVPTRGFQKELISLMKMLEWLYLWAFPFQT